MPMNPEPGLSIGPQKIRIVLIYAVSVFVSFALLACSVEQIVEVEQEATREVQAPVKTPVEVVEKDVRTVEVEKPVVAEATKEFEVEKVAEKEVEVPETTVPVPTPTVAEATTVAPEEEQQVEVLQVNIPNRGYNLVGSPNAPITMFDFSDFT